MSCTLFCAKFCTNLILQTKKNFFNLANNYYITDQCPAFRLPSRLTIPSLVSLLIYLIVCCRETLDFGQISQS